MIKVTIIFDNKFASPYPPIGFIRKYYLTDMGKDDLIAITNIEQEDHFAELTDKMVE